MSATTNNYKFSFILDLRNTEDDAAKVVEDIKETLTVVGGEATATEDLGVREFEQAFTRTFVRKSYRLAAAGRPTRFVISPILSFAKDLDTKAEFAEVVRSLSCVSD